ncbi:hypothetical protein BLA60_08890 [Actinophytocola xinjiangensis]|uniref:Uncharacterized protein n=1 Tax=Actinophytocola xinjiangensis TaxID=485602 RepID=A0A7Z0WP51_9PSEU|nr:hypothetical protein BLA60_08890 [Actinophytocola xinjiangensis]
MRASGLLGVRQCDIDPGRQLITVVRKESRAVQQVPTSGRGVSGTGALPRLDTFARCRPLKIASPR